MDIDLDYSVVMAVKDGENYINEALDSISIQSIKPKEVIIVDDHSANSLIPLANNYQNISVISAQKNGQMAALNQGLSKVTTEYVAFLDHDDYWGTRRQSQHKDLFSINNKLDFAISPVANFIEEENAKIVDMGPSRVLGAITFKTEFIRKVGNFNENLKHHGIIEWWMRAEKIGFRYATGNEIGLYRRIHQNNSGLVSKNEARKSLFQILRASSGG